MADRLKDLLRGAVPLEVTDAPAIKKAVYKALLNMPVKVMSSDDTFDILSVYVADGHVVIDIDDGDDMAKPDCSNCGKDDKVKGGFASEWSCARCKINWFEPT